MQLPYLKTCRKEKFSPVKLIQLIKWILAWQGKPCKDGKSFVVFKI